MENRCDRCNKALNGCPTTYMNGGTYCNSCAETIRKREDFERRRDI